MTSRRKFIQGAISAAVAASLPGGDGVALYSAKHPSAPALLPLVNDPNTGFYTNSTYDFATHGTRMAQALAHSMMQTAKENILTKEIVAANVFNRAFDPSSLENIEIDIPE